MGDWQIADLVHHEQGRVRERLEPAVQASCSLGFLERCDEVGQRPVVDAPSALCGCHGETQSQMSLAHSGRPEEYHVLLPLHKAQLMETLDLLPFDRGLKGEIEVGQCLDCR